MTDTFEDECRSYDGYINKENSVIGVGRTSYNACVSKPVKDLDGRDMCKMPGAFFHEGTCYSDLSNYSIATCGSKHDQGCKLSMTFHRDATSTGQFGVAKAKCDCPAELWQGPSP